MTKHRLWILILFLALIRETFAFVPPSQNDPRLKTAAFAKKKKPNTNIPKGRRNSEQQKNWIERAVPLDTSNDVVREQLEKVEYYSLGLSGITFQTGPLSAQLLQMMLTRNKEKITSKEVEMGYRVYAMDFSAKEAVREALRQNGFELTLTEYTQDIGLWGEIESIRLLDGLSNEPLDPVYKSWEDAVEHWEPGQAFDFVVRQVPAKLSEVTLENVLESLDPDGEVRRRAEEDGLELVSDLNSLGTLKNDAVRRCDRAPREASTEDEAFRGDSRRGYRVIRRSDLLEASKNVDGSENAKTLAHVMDALVSHGCLIVDLSDDQTSFDISKQISKMWENVSNFFSSLDEDPDQEAFLSPMESIEASPFAKLGYANYNNGVKFLETRLDRKRNLVLPTDLVAFIGSDGVDELRQSFESLAEVGKDIIRIATAASTWENKGFPTSMDAPSISGVSFQSEDVEAGDADDQQSAIKASQAATRMVRELVDDGKALDANALEGEVSMSPHRFCCYTNGEESSTTSKEVFGAHTDSSFVTMIPVAAVSGFEVYDESAMKWYRPELRARDHWEEERSKRDGKTDPMLNHVGDTELPWHSNYVAVIPGEFLQIACRNEVEAAVHRVVASSTARLSAPVLLRGRPGVKLNVSRYLGVPNHGLLKEVDGMQMEDLHNEMQDMQKALQ